MSKKPKKSRKPGRPSDLTPTAAKRIVRAITAGNTHKDAATAAGIDQSTFCRWMKLGRAARRGPYYEFRKAVEGAKAKAATGFVKVIRKAARERSVVTTKETQGVDLNGQPMVRRETVTKREFDWGAAAWWLERARPEDWSANKHELRELRKQLDLMARQLAELTRGNRPPDVATVPPAQLPSGAGPAGAAGGSVGPRPVAGGPDIRHAGGGAVPGPVAGGTDPQPGSADNRPLHSPVGEDADGGGEGGGPVFD